MKTRAESKWPNASSRLAGSSNACAATLCAAIAAAALCSALLWSAFHRGPWYDEFYTWVVARPDRPFLVSLRESWLADNHPPLYYMLAWAGRSLAPSIEYLRLLNLLGLVAASTGGWIVFRRFSQHWPLAALFCLTLAANESVLRSATEARSYFLSLCAGSVVVVALTIGWLEGNLAGRGQRAALWVALLIGFNLHVLTSLILGALLVPFVALAWLRSRRAFLRDVLMPATVGSCLFLATSAVQAQTWGANTVKFWIPAGFSAARWAIEYAVLRTAEANSLTLAGGIAGAAVLLTACLRRRALSPTLECMILLGAGVILSSVLLIGLHLIRPVVTERYLTALIPAVAMGIALGGAALMRSLPPRIGNGFMIGACAMTLWALMGNASHTVGRNSWEGTAARLDQLVRECPDTAVHIDPPFWNAFAFSLPPRDNRVVIADAYQLMAKRHNFRIEPATSRRISAACPTLFWAEHDTTRTWNADSIAEHVRAQGFGIDRIWQIRIGDGWIASNRPLDLPHSPN